jgi:hypothetical protein
MSDTCVGLIVGVAMCWGFGVLEVPLILRIPITFLDFPKIGKQLLSKLRHFSPIPRLVSKIFGRSGNNRKEKTNVPLIPRLVSNHSKGAGT